MTDLERLFRALAASKLEDRLEDASLGPDERRLIEAELGRRRQTASVPAGPRRTRRHREARKPPSLARRLLPYVIVYGVPVASFLTLGCVAILQQDERMHPAGLTVKGLLLALIAPAIEGFREVGGFVVVLLSLALIAAFAVKPHPLTGTLSFFAFAAWLFFGFIIVSVKGI